MSNNDRINDNEMTVDLNYYCYLNQVTAIISPYEKPTFSLS